MPEGLEVFVLAKSLKNIGIECRSHGKHLFIKDPHTGKLKDVTFGLYGRVKLTRDLKFSKTVVANKPSGEIKEIGDFKLGPDWMTLSYDEVVGILNSWKHRKKQIHALLTEQSEIAGIGSYWVYKILKTALVDPNTKANLLEFFNMIEPLARAVIKVRDRVVKEYLASIQKDEIAFVNGWCENLYSIRDEIKV